MTQALVQVCLVKLNPGIVYNLVVVLHVHDVTNGEFQQRVQALLQFRSCVWR